MDSRHFTKDSHHIPENHFMNAAAAVEAAEFPGISRTEPMVSRPPSPPQIFIPSLNMEDKSGLQLVPDASLISPTLTQSDLAIITGGTPARADDGVGSFWTFEKRRQAQAVLDYMYLGPTRVAKDPAWLKKEGITMLIPVRDIRLAKARLLNVERWAHEAGIAHEYIDVYCQQELISLFPAAVETINHHLVDYFKKTGKRGKVLVCCETGNDRSAAIVAAYIMTMYNTDMVHTLQFIGLTRFCTNFDEQVKWILRAYEDILLAQRMVNEHYGPMIRARQALADSAAAAKKRDAERVEHVFHRSKRGRDDDATQGGDGGSPSNDIERFRGRSFTPFVDSDAMDEED